MGDKKSPFGYLIAALLGAVAGATFVAGFFRFIPRMMDECMKKMKKEGIEPPECCQEMMKTGGKKRKK